MSHWKTLLRRGGLITVFVIALTFLQGASLSTQVYAGGGGGNDCDQYTAKQIAPATDESAPVITTVYYNVCSSDVVFFFPAARTIPAFEIGYKSPGMITEDRQMWSASKLVVLPYEEPPVYGFEFATDPESPSYTFRVRNCYDDHTLVSGGYRCADGWSNVMTIATPYTGPSTTPTPTSGPSTTPVITCAFWWLC